MQEDLNDFNLFFLMDVLAGGKAIIVFIVFALTMDILSWQAKSISLFCAAHIHACVCICTGQKMRLRRALTIYF